MPTQPPRACAHPGCCALVVTGPRCPDHAKHAPKVIYDQTTRRNDPALAAAARFRSRPQWKRFRAWFRAQHPLCCDPFRRHGAMPAFAEAVHHVVPLALRPDLGLTPANCRPLCTACHNRIEGMERRGEPTQHLFAVTPTGRV